MSTAVGARGECGGAGDPARWCHDQRSRLGGDHSRWAPPSVGRDGGRLRVFAIWGFAVVVLALGFAAGRVTRGRPAPEFPCGDRVIGIIEAVGLPNGVLEVSAALRPTGRGDAPVPLPSSQTVELVGTAAGDQGFRPVGGRLVLAVEVPRSSVGKSAEITRAGEVVTRVPLTSPLCRVEEAQRSKGTPSGFLSHPAHFMCRRSGAQASGRTWWGKSTRANDLFVLSGYLGGSARTRSQAASHFQGGLVSQSPRTLRATAGSSRRMVSRTSEAAASSVPEVSRNSSTSWASRGVACNGGG
jgi:hypothetical protein